MVGQLPNPVTCDHNYEWVEEPGWQSRVLEYVRVCTVCRHSPDRWEGPDA